MKKGRKLPAVLTYLFLAVYLVYFAAIGNYEFLVYIIVTALVFYILMRFDDYYGFPLYAIWMFVVWVILHMLGGSVIINDAGARLYAWVIFNWVGEPYLILKYDQVVHAYTYFVFSIFVYYALKRHVKDGQKAALIIFTVLVSIGIGMLNEVVEFAMVVFANAAEGVGDYYNTALDMVFNLIGSILGVWFVGRNGK